MCGLAGFVPFHSQNPELLHRHGAAMAEALQHRGPDQQACWVSENSDIVLSHARLSIQDLSDAGRQPMQSADGRYHLIYNGEIYNFQDLKKQFDLKPKGHSDTEILLLMLMRFGVAKTLIHLRGMFAFVLYDAKERVIHCARDPMGKKPLYLGWGKAGFYIASEMRAVFATGEARPAINPDVLDLFLRWRYVPDPYCIFENFWKVPPGHTVSLKLDDLKSPFNLAEKFVAFWSLTDCANQEADLTDEQQALNHLDHVLSEAITKRLIADVPLGVFLSGGIDSTLIAAMAQKQSGTPLNSFTIAFDDAAYNEASMARQTAQALGTYHTEIMVRGCDALNLAERIAGQFDEPFADPSALPTYLLCQNAKTKMTVALSGDGGDESFGGYSWYQRAESLRSILAVPHSIRCLIATLLKLIPHPQLQKIMAMIVVKDWDALYPALMTYWDALQSDRKIDFLPTAYDDLKQEKWPKSPVEKLMAFDTKMFLSGDVLTKVDRCSMAHGLEVRSPLLDIDVVQTAWHMPLTLKRQNGQGKSILRALLKRYYPAYNFQQPKQGFSIPHGRWLREDLNDWAEGLFNPQQIQAVEPDLIKPFWARHKAGQGDYGHYLWTHAMLQSWLRHQAGV